MTDNWEDPSSFDFPKDKKRRKKKPRQITESVFDMNEELLILKKEMKSGANLSKAKKQIEKREEQKLNNRKIGYEKRKLKTKIKKEENTTNRLLLQSDLKGLEQNQNFTLKKFGLKHYEPLSYLDNEIKATLGQDMNLVIDDSMGLEKKLTYNISLNKLLTKYNPALYLMQNMKKRWNGMYKKAQEDYKNGKCTKAEIEGLEKLKDVIDYNIGTLKGEQIKIKDGERQYPMMSTMVYNNIRIN